MAFWDPDNLKVMYLDMLEERYSRGKHIEVSLIKEAMDYLKDSDLDGDEMNRFRTIQSLYNENKASEDRRLAEDHKRMVEGKLAGVIELSEETKQLQAQTNIELADQGERVGNVADIISSCKGLVEKGRKSITSALK